MCSFGPNLGFRENSDLSHFIILAINIAENAKDVKHFRQRRIAAGNALFGLLNCDLLHFGCLDLWGLLRQRNFKNSVLEFGSDFLHVNVVAKLEGATE